MDRPIKKVEDYLNEISYEVDPNYVPSNFALEFVTFIKLVDGGDTENKTPVIHYHILDNFLGETEEDDRDTLNMCFRGAAKSTLKEYLMLYVGVYNKLPIFGRVPYGIYVSDSIDNGIKKMRKALEYRYEHSLFLKKYIPKVKLTDTRWEFINLEGKSSVFGGYGAKALSLDTMVLTATGYMTIREISKGEMIFGPDGKLTRILDKSKVFNRPMYRITLKDGRSLKVCEEHINNITIKDPHRSKYKNINISTKDLLDQPLTHTRKGRKNKTDIVFIDNIKPLEYAKRGYRIEPYLLGCLLAKGRIRPDCGYTELKIYHNARLNEYKKNRIKDNLYWLKGIDEDIRFYGLNVNKKNRFIPEQYMTGNIQQRLDLLQGIMDSIGGINQYSMFGKKYDVITVEHESDRLVQDIYRLVYSLGGCIDKGKIELDMPLFSLGKKLNKLVGSEVSKRVAIESVERIENEPSQCIRVGNKDKQFVVNQYIRTHNTGVRGTRENNSRPVIALLDDLISDEDARSPTVIASVEDTVYKAIEYALHPKRRKVIWSGTPFNAKDPLYKAVESGAWKVNVYPVCEEFPCEKHEFKGAWEDRFDYENIKKRYEKALLSGKIDTFNQEMMLRIMSDEDRLIKDTDIRWYSKITLASVKGSFNYYITTDFATSEKSSADFSVISVWALNSKGDWFWVDGICEKQLMDQNVNDLFRLAQKYKPQQVGIEVTGQQGGFIKWIQNEMMSRNNYFTLATQGNNNLPGIRPNTNKMQRFNNMVPIIKAGKLYFPEEDKTTKPMLEAMEEIKLASPSGFKSKHDDFIDTISMLADLETWRPNDDIGSEQQESDDLWDWDKPESTSNLESYI